MPNWSQRTPTEGTPSSGLVQCSFCGKTQREVTKLIAGPGVYICNECVNLCNEILSDEAMADPSRESGPAPAYPSHLSTEVLLDLLKGTATTLTGVEADVRRKVAAARSRGVGWDAIGETLGLGPEDAEERFGVGT